MLVRTGVMKVDLAQSFIAKGCGFFGAHPAEDVACDFRVKDRISCAEPGFGGKGRALRQGIPEGSCINIEFFYFGAFNPAGISAGQPNSAPRVSLICERKRSNGAGNPGGICTLDEPQAAPQALIKNVASMW